MLSVMIEKQVTDTVKHVCRLILTGLLLVPAAWAESREEQQGSEGWVEDNLNPGTEWVERMMTPFNRWVERQIQEPQMAPDDSSVLTDFQDGSPPPGAISPQEAGRLILLLEDGQILKVQYLPVTPPTYEVRLLNSAGRISHHYLNAMDGTLLDQPPAGNPSPSDAGGKP